jgi:hypothetical protein
MTTSSAGGSGPHVKQRSPSASPSSSSSAAGAAPARSQRVYPEAFAGADTLPRVEAEAAIEANDGRQVRLVGTYVERDVRMDASPPAVHLGHVAIELADGTSVAFLTAWSKDGPRPQAEIERLRGTKVEVVGTLFASGIPHPQGGAAAMEPTIVDVKALRPAP